MRPDILKRFLTNTDETGRFLMKSRITGIIYFVEPLYNGKHRNGAMLIRQQRNSQGTMVPNIPEQLLKKNRS